MVIHQTAPDGEHRRRDEPLASEYVSGRAGERCCQRNREGVAVIWRDLCSETPNSARELRQQASARKGEEIGESAAATANRRKSMAIRANNARVETHNARS